MRKKLNYMKSNWKTLSVISLALIAILFLVNYRYFILARDEYKHLLSQDFDTAFKDYYTTELDHVVVRSAGFKKILDLASANAQRTGKPIVMVETGSITSVPIDFKNDGGSTLIFSHFLGNKGILHSVDTNKNGMAIINDVLGLTNVKFHHQNSLEFLRHFPNPQDINVLYLDSSDIPFAVSNEAMKYHLAELEAVFDKLEVGTVIAVDDNVIIDGQKIGKGYLVEDFLLARGVPLVYNGFQKIFQIQTLPLTVDVLVGTE
jgi:hypothetical protein